MPPPQAVASDVANALRGDGRESKVRFKGSVWRSPSTILCEGKRVEGRKERPIKLGFDRRLACRTSEADERFPKIGKPVTLEEEVFQGRKWSSIGLVKAVGRAIGVRWEDGVRGYFYAGAR